MSNAEILETLKLIKIILPPDSENPGDTIAYIHAAIDQVLKEMLL